MISFPGYQVNEMLYESSNSYVFRAYHNKNQVPVVIKLLKGEYPSPERIVLFRREYEILKGLDLKGTIKALSFESFNNSFAIVMEDIGAKSIRKILEKKTLDLYEFLELSVKISDVLNQLHQKNIIHKNINPTNIVWNQKTDQVYIIDFGISTILSTEIAAIQNPNEFEGTLSYISPEQTGRMNRMIDYRSDMYSLGITLYEIMTGQVPFYSKDAMELIHYHLAKAPLSPHLLKSTLFGTNSLDLEILSKIILKLISKTAEDRYLSYYGLKYDLDRCLKYLRKKHTLSGLEFELGRKDFSDVFQIPQKLYGRENEIETLLDAFKRVCNKSQGGQVSEMMIVKGYAGIGKSALVNEIHIPIIDKRGYFISGKYEMLKRNIPYSALTQAFKDLMRQILIENETSIKQWKTRILEAVGPNGQVIIDVIPEVELIIGKQPPVPELSPQEKQNRFNRYFQNFVRTFARENHPLVIFLDDLHWADIPSLKLLEMLILDSRTKYMFIIGAYRDNEVNPSHPLIISLDRIKNENAIINYITLPSLETEHINQLISDALGCDISNTEGLSKVCLAKTNGNPFFLIQFLNSLVDKKLIEFNPETLKWECDTNKIERTDITSNVVELLSARIHKLSEKTKRILKLASCIGNRFDLEILSIINEEATAETANEMQEAINSGLIQPIGEGYKLAEHLDLVKDNISFERLVHKIQYKFLHDRVHQAAYSLMGDEFKQIHLKIGKLLLQKLTVEERDERIFDIVNHLNSGKDLISDQKEKNELAELNLVAGRKAKAATAYEIALQYFNTGLYLLGPDTWERHYTLSLEMNLETAEASYLNGNFEKMDNLAKDISQHAKTLLDRIRINEIVIQSFIARGRITDSIGIAIAILKELGINLSPEPNNLNIFFRFIYLRIILSTKKIENLRNLPVMTDTHKLAAMRILMNAISSAYYTNIKLAITMAFKMIHLSVRYGNSPFSAFGYSLYGIILQGLVGKIVLGYKFGEFSIEMLNKFNKKEYETTIGLLFNLFVKHWRDKLSETIEPFSELFQRGLENGNNEFASYCKAYVGIHSYHAGVKLEIVAEETKNGIEVVNKLNHEMTLIVIKLIRQVVLNLMGKSKNTILLIGEDYDEIEMESQFIKNNDMADLGALYTMKAFLSFTFENISDSLKYAQEAEKYKLPMIGLVYLSLIYFYTSLIYMSHYNSASLIKRISYLQKTYFNQKQLKKWAKYSPENYLHRWHLIEAERCKITNRHLKAMKHYDEAILLARENEYTQEEALANELAAKYYLSKRNIRIARAYIKEACYLYKIWGANAKVKHLNEKYPELFYALSDDNGKEKEIEDAMSGVVEIHSEKIDLATVQKASQAISGEIHLDKLLEKLLNIVITNAGAQKGYLLLKDDEGLFIEGEVHMDNKEVVVLQHIPFTECQDIALTIINYVLRINKLIVLDHAADKGNFKSDEYILRNEIRSVLCLPLMFHNKLRGILYLENNLAPGTFTSERVEVLKILTGQIVISIENARLYKSLEEYNQTLEENVTRRTAEISMKNEQLNIQKEELRVTLENLKQSQFQLVQSEKMASLGQLVAGIAHEINNPVTFISAGVDSLSENLEEIRQVLNIYHRIKPENVKEKLKEIEELKKKVEYIEAIKEINKLIESIKNGSNRTSEIVRGLRTFSRLDEDSIKSADIHGGLDSTLILLQNKYKNRIEIVKNYGNIPLIECYPGQLNQVFMNILSNAIDAIEDKGTIILTTSRTKEQIQISIRDSGRGITDNLKEKIFEPFYTTKDVGEGTGLGLSISHGIVEKHNGSINVISKVGEGSEFIILLPIRQNNELPVS